MRYRKMDESKIGFAVVKLDFGGVPFFLMRKNEKWKDVNFIGGHENPRDQGSLLRAAQREFWEEVPSSRNVETKLEELTDQNSARPDVFQVRSKDRNIFSTVLPCANRG